MKFFKKHKKGLIVLLVIVVIVAGVGTWIKVSANKALTALATASTETAVAENRDLVSVVTATGKITSVQSKNIVSTTTGVKIKEVDVEVGDEVKAGDVIAVLESDSLEESLESANTSLSNTKKSNNISVNSAQRSYNEAVTNGTVQAERYAEQIADAEKNIKDYKALRDQAENMYKAAVEDTATTYAAYQAALASLDSISSGDISANDKATDAKKQIAAAQTAWETAKNAESAALSQYQSYITQVEQLESSYDTLIDNRDDAALQIQSNLAATQDQLSSAKISASGSTDSLETQISNLEDQIAACTVTAPFDGVITALNAEAGDLYAGTSLATVEDVSSYEITAEIDEYDIGKIYKGQKVIIKTNGTGDTELEGTVKSVAPRATVGSTSVTYTVVVSIDTPNDLLRLDMTAKLSIILESSENTLTVPYDAVLTDDDGNKYVEVVTGKDETTGAVQTKNIYVTTGIESDYYIEITGGDLKAGEEVKVEREESTVFDFSAMLSEDGATDGM